VCVMSFAHLDMSGGPHDFLPHTDFSLDSGHIFYLIVPVLLINELTERYLHTPPGIVEKGEERIVAVEAEPDDGRALGPGHEGRFLLLHLWLPIGCLIGGSGLDRCIIDLLEDGVEVTDVDRLLCVKRVRVGRRRIKLSPSPRIRNILKESIFDDDIRSVSSVRRGRSGETRTQTW
jgi:hypothetical protein